MVEADRKLLGGFLFLGAALAIEIPLAAITTLARPSSFLHAILTNSDDLTAIGTLVIAAFATVQWRETRKTSQRQLRAYVCVLKRTIKFENLLSFCVEIELRNSGQTPAYKLCYLTKVFVQAPPGPTVFDLPAFDHESIATASLGPSEDTILWEDRTLTEGELIGIKEGKLAIWMIGEVRYRDAFDRRQFTRFRSSVDQSDLAIHGDERMNITDDENELS